MATDSEEGGLRRARAIKGVEQHAISVRAGYGVMKELAQGRLRQNVYFPSKLKSSDFDETWNHNRTRFIWLVLGLCILLVAHPSRIMYSLQGWGEPKIKTVRLDAEVNTFRRFGTPI